MKKYEAMFIFPEALKDEALSAALKKAQEEIKRAGGEIENVHPLGKRAFARPMKKQEAGHYALVTLRLDPQQVAPLQARYRLDENIFRVQITEPSQAGAGRITVPADADERGERNGQP